MQLINRISVLLLCIWFVEDVYMKSCRHYELAGIIVSNCDLYDELRIEGQIKTLSDKINMKIKFTGYGYDLHLVKSDRNILNENTILWSISLDNKNHIQSSKSNLYKTYPMLKDSQVYVDHQNAAVLRTYLLNDVYIFEGIVGPYQFFYDDNSQKYIYLKIFPTDQKIYADEQIDHQKYFNLQSPEKDLTMRLLIAGDAINIPRENQTMWMRYLFCHFTAADYMFSKFSSPSIKLSIAGFIFFSDVSEKKAESTEVSLSDEDRKYFVGDNFDVAFFLSNNSKPRMDNIERTWSLSAIKTAGKIPFLNTLDKASDMDINHWNVAENLANAIREKYLPTFPFFLNVSQVIRDPFNLLKAWRFTGKDDDITTPSSTTASTTEIISTSTPSSTTTASTTTAAANASINLPVSDSTTNNKSQGNSNYIVFGCLSAGLLLLALLFVILITMRRSKFTVWWAQKKNKNSKQVRKIFSENCIDEEY